MEQNQLKRRAIVLTRKASFRLLAIIICFAAVLWLAAACAEPQDEAMPTPEPWTNPCADERTVVKHAGDEKLIEEYVAKVMYKHYFSLFVPYPHFQTVFVVDMTDRNANGEAIYGIEVGVIKHTDPSTLPHERRIPDCLEGVPVRIVKEGKIVLGKVILTEGR